MKKSLWILAALLTAFAGQASADFLSADLAGAGGEGFASLVTAGGQISYTILTSNVGTPTGAFINQGGTQVVDLQADFDFGTAAGSAAAAAALITQIENNTSAYTLVVATAGGNLTGTLQNAGDSGGGGPGPTPQPGVLQFTVDTINTVEGQNAAVQVSRTGGSSGAVGVTYATAGGSATSGADFTAANGTLVVGRRRQRHQVLQRRRSPTTPPRSSPRASPRNSPTPPAAPPSRSTTAWSRSSSARATSAPASPAPRACACRSAAVPTSTAASASTSTTRACAPGACPARARSSRSTASASPPAASSASSTPTTPRFWSRSSTPAPRPSSRGGCSTRRPPISASRSPSSIARPGDVKTFTNEDLHAADPVQDTRAFLTCAAN